MIYELMTIGWYVLSDLRIFKIKDCCFEYSFSNFLNTYKSKPHLNPIVEGGSDIRCQNEQEMHNNNDAQRRLFT